MQSHILLVAPQSSSTTLVRALNRTPNLGCTHTPSIKRAVEYLETEEFSIILLDKNLISAIPSAPDALFQRAGIAQVLELDVKRLDVPRVLLEVRAAMNRRAHYQWRAYETARERLSAEFRSDISVLITEAESILQSAGRLEASRVRRIAQAAGNLWNQLEIV